MKQIKDLTNNDIVYLKSGAMGVVSKIFDNIFGDGEPVYEIKLFDNETIIRRSKDFVECI